MSRKYARKGFTIVEVTLAIVIGIILIAGATLIYNQAKQAAGNSRAQAKTSSMQSLIEQFLARSDGVPPDILAVRAMWEKARSEDFNKSPWGGRCIPCQGESNETVDLGVNAQHSDVIARCGNVTQPGDYLTLGVLDGCTLDKDKDDLNTSQPGAMITEPPRDNLPPNPSTRGPVDTSYNSVSAAGIMLYYRFADAGAYGIWDESRRDMMWGKSYAIAITNTGGQRWYFVNMNRTGGGGEAGNILNGAQIDN